MAVVTGAYDHSEEKRMQGHVAPPGLLYQQDTLGQHRRVLIMYNSVHMTGYKRAAVEMTVYNNATLHDNKQLCAIACNN